MPERARTFAADLALSSMRVPSILAGLGLVSYSAYFMPPVLLDVCDKIPFPQSYSRLPELQAGGSVASSPCRWMPLWPNWPKATHETGWGYRCAH